jgi:hypothetical protein
MKEVTQDLDRYRVPADLEALLRILVKILEPYPLCLKAHPRPNLSATFLLLATG